MIGARLKQARMRAGMTQSGLADELQKVDFQITKQSISKYEREKSFPSAEFLLLASRALDVPSAYLLHEPAKAVEWLAFRCRARMSQREKAKIMAYAQDIAELQIELRDLFYPEPWPELPSICVRSLEEAETAAAQLRDHWQVGNRPLHNLAQTAEDRGLVVIGWEDQTGLFDGLSGHCGGAPVTVIDTSVPADRQRLTLAHEIGHLVMDAPDDEADEEKLAFRFAAALLAPADHARRELGNRRSHLDWGELESLKRKYGLSMAAWVRRAYDLDIINCSVYTNMNRDLRTRGWHKEEPGEFRGEEAPLQLTQLAQRAVSEGLMSPDRITRVAADVLADEADSDYQGDYPNAIQLLEMDEADREMWMSKMFELAENMEFEVFDAFGEEYF